MIYHHLKEIFAGAACLFFLTGCDSKTQEALGKIVEQAIESNRVAHDFRQQQAINALKGQGIAVEAASPSGKKKDDPAFPDLSGLPAGEYRIRAGDGFDCAVTVTEAHGKKTIREVCRPVCS